MQMKLKPPSLALMSSGIGDMTSASAPMATNSDRKAQGTWVIGSGRHFANCMASASLVPRLGRERRAVCSEVFRPEAQYISLGSQTEIDPTSAVQTGAPVTAASKGGFNRWMQHTSMGHGKSSHWVVCFPWVSCLQLRGAASYPPRPAGRLSRPRRWPRWITRMAMPYLSLDSFI